MDAAAWIRARLAGFSCAACGRTYRPDTIHVLARRERLFFVALDCGGCDGESVAIISVEPASGALEGTPTALPTEAAGSVSGADVLAMHEFLAQFDGDFRALFGASPERPGPAGA